MKKDNLSPILRAMVTLRTPETRDVLERIGREIAEAAPFATIAPVTQGEIDAYWREVRVGKIQGVFSPEYWQGSRDRALRDLRGYAAHQGIATS